MYNKLIQLINNLNIDEFSLHVPEVKMCSFSEQQTLLQSTSKIPNRVEFFKLLVAQIEDLEVLEDNQGGALRWASEIGSLHEVKILLDKGVNPNLYNGDALSKASLNNHKEVSDLLIAYGANLNLAVKGSIPKSLSDHFKTKDLSKKRDS